MVVMAGRITPSPTSSIELRKAVAQEKIDAIRAMLAEKPRPIGWAERRARVAEGGSGSARAPDNPRAPGGFGPAPRGKAPSGGGGARPPGGGSPAPPPPH